MKTSNEAHWGYITQRHLQLSTPAHQLPQCARILLLTPFLPAPHRSVRLCNPPTTNPRDKQQRVRLPRVPTPLKQPIHRPLDSDKKMNHSTVLSALWKPRRSI
ncbi:hypothetical protein ROHU_031277 [Labeo rohita]|uniref:Uncharacterized protein n=1 Tax=Labeo rohita TaxID=84645 RepID=A0A498LN98_LABRO|nr:hypothetical protein ROHU_031277 [Labeo rohita]